MRSRLARNNGNHSEQWCESLLQEDRLSEGCCDTELLCRRWFILYPVKDLINTQFISAAVKEGGVGRFSATELNKFLAGKTVRINAGVGNETQSISGNSSIKDIRTLFTTYCLIY